MKYLKIAIVLSCIALSSFFQIILLPVNAALAAEVKQSQGGNKGLLNRIDFENAYIMGQTIKSGAVYLLHRKKNEINSMIKYRESYRDEILEDFSILDMKVEKQD